MHVRNKGRKITMNFQVPAPYLAWPRLSKTLCVEKGLTRTFIETRETKVKKITMNFQVPAPYPAWPRLAGERKTVH